MLSRTSASFNAVSSPSFRTSSAPIGSALLASPSRPGSSHLVIPYSWARTTLSMKFSASIGSSFPMANSWTELKPHIWDSFNTPIHSSCVTGSPSDCETATGLTKLKRGYKSLTHRMLHSIWLSTHKGHNTFRSDSKSSFLMPSRTIGFASDCPSAFWASTGSRNKSWKTSDPARELLGTLNKQSST